ncbi:hypothetical protein DICPUDRAFT_94663 [Dictyostelium purpureum]|uniref:FNIP repeat-containing protein n=1 Tax=Dictyostelium purpureum TaxID=5786 RepID=F0ZM52_DICPU|nr:uncharacterized protein DICPUDRAFT_94663 [Dictyostelium purpureum]EGC34965.1 hypothetical protein DICPUDRAFT_94663 [Dictyostelium purpureum]|eukprot:XP_003288490.1 hypothetical protein DICPUDRAFT_94663 [Dictyostelium purpureum]
MIVTTNQCKFTIVWNNTYLRKIIIKYLRLYHLFSYIRYFPSINSILKFKFKEYLKEIEIDGRKGQDGYHEILFSDDEEEEDDEEEQLKLPPSSLSNINIPKSVTVVQLFYSIRSPSGLEMFKSNQSSISKLHLYRLDSSLKINYNILSDSITELTLFEYHHEIKKDTLPKGLTKLNVSFDGLHQKKSMFEKGSLPGSLTHLTVQCFSQHFNFKSGILPNKLLYLKIASSVYQEIPKDYRFPDSLIHLEIKCKDLKTKLPINLTSLHIQTSKEIKDYSLPSLLKYLYISTCQPLSSRLLPKYLLSLETDADSIGVSVLPETLQRLILRTDGSGLLNFNIKLLPKMMPSSLTYLNFDFDGYGSFNNGGFPMIEENIFPSTLTYLNLGNGFNQPIGVNTLPNSGNLKTLILGISFSQEIVSNSIPPSVLYFHIKNSSYQHFIKLNNPYTVIKICDSNNNYFRLYKPNPQDLRVLRLSSNFNEPIHSLELRNKTNLEYLQLNKLFNHDLLLEDLPINNSIKVLILGNSFNKLIHLEYFQNLETLIIKNSNPKIIASIFYNNDNKNDPIYNFYNLKVIEVRAGNNRFLDGLEEVFYQFVRLSKEKEKKSKNMY